MDLYAGPYEEGSQVHLSCIVMGGKPPPRVVWYKNSQLFSEQFVRQEDVMTGQMVTYNNLTLIAIPRYTTTKEMFLLTFSGLLAE